MSRRQQAKDDFTVLPKGPASSADLQSAEWKDGKFEFPLAREVSAFDEKRKSLTFREPGAGDIIAVGNPVRFDPASSPPTVEFIDSRMAAMLSRLAEVPVSTIAQMSPKDYVAACWVVAPFFMPV